MNKCQLERHNALAEVHAGIHGLPWCRYSTAAANEAVKRVESYAASSRSLGDANAVDAIGRLFPFIMSFRDASRVSIIPASLRYVNNNPDKRKVRWKQVHESPSMVVDYVEERI